MDEVFAANRAELCGMVAGVPRYSHESRGTEFYIFPLETCRLSGTADRLNIVLRRDMVTPLLEEGATVRVTGELRSFNNKTGVGNRLILTIFARNIEPWYGEDENRITLTGTICKEPGLRMTPMGREICDLILAVGRRYHRSDYIPVITWGLQAREVARCEVGDRLSLQGRLQSRVYTKIVDGVPEERIAFEVSAADVTVLA